VIVCTEDSSTMISEAVSARLPVVGVAPAAHRFTEEEQEYRNFLVANGWCRVLPIAQLDPDTFATAIAEIEPIPAGFVLAPSLTSSCPGSTRASRGDKPGASSPGLPGQARQ
jgi:hypothetical protein